MATIFSFGRQMKFQIIRMDSEYHVKQTKRSPQVGRTFRCDKPPGCIHSIDPNRIQQQECLTLVLERKIPAIPSGGYKWAEILPSCPSLDTNNRAAGIGFEPRAFRSASSRFKQKFLLHQVITSHGVVVVVLALIVIASVYSWTAVWAKRNAVRDEFLKKKIISKFYPKLRNNVRSLTPFSKEGDHMTTVVRHQLPAIGICTYPANRSVKKPDKLTFEVKRVILALLKYQRNIPDSSRRNLSRRIIRRQVKVSVRVYGEAWWTPKAKKMEDAQKAGNARRLFRLIRATGPPKISLRIHLLSKKQLIILRTACYIVLCTGINIFFRVHISRKTERRGSDQLVDEGPGAGQQSDTTDWRISRPNRVIMLCDSESRILKNLHGMKVLI
ncbi:endonuclease-reverse transcriptase, partial [Clonorchis sinensis]